MGGARALIASLGASISLVAGAALSLLVISFVFAYDGLTGSGYDGAGANAQVVVPDLPETTRRVAQRTVRSSNAVVIAAPATRPVVERQPARRETAFADVGVEERRPAVPRSVIPPPPPDSTNSSSEPQASDPGDGVRELGDSVSSTVDDTGAATTGVTAPLGPPVTEAVQEILNLLNGLIGGATGGLAGALDQAAAG